MEIIKSKDNNKIKYIKSLNLKKIRDTQNSFVVEGVKFVTEAIKEKSDVKFVMFSKDSLNRYDVADLINELKIREIDFYICEDNIFKSAADTVKAQGVLAVINKKYYDENQLLTENNFMIICDHIQDPGNLGTIIRTADAFGPSAVILNKGCVDLYNPKVVRATAGAMFRVPFIVTENEIHLLNRLKDEGFYIISTIVDSMYSFDDIHRSNKICIVIGNEGHGISQEIIDASHMNVTIKMNGKAESLNASIAAGISIYEIRKKLLKL